MKRSKILAAIFSITVLLSGACLVGCSGTNGVFGSTYNDWQEGENKVGNATINLTGFNKVELNWDDMKLFDIEDTSSSIERSISHITSSCMPSSFRLDNRKLCDAFDDDSKYESLQRDLSKLNNSGSATPTEAQTKAAAQELADSHVSLYKRSSEDSSNTVAQVLLWQVRMSDELFEKILEAGTITEVGNNVYEYKNKDTRSKDFFCVKNGDTLTFIYASSLTSSHSASYSDILSY